MKKEIINNILLIVIVILGSVVLYILYKNKHAQEKEIADIRKDIQFEIENIRKELYLLDSLDRISNEQLNNVKTKLVYIKKIPIIQDEDSLINSVNKTLGYE
jgi:hypothetical protein